MGYGDLKFGFTKNENNKSIFSKCINFKQYNSNNVKSGKNFGMYIK